MYGQKSNLRSKVFINTLYTKSNNSISWYIKNFATNLSADFSGNSPPLPPTRNASFQILCFILRWRQKFTNKIKRGVWIMWPNNKLISFYCKLRKCLFYIHVHNSLMKFVNVYVQDMVHIIQNTLFLTNFHRPSLNAVMLFKTVKYWKMRLISIMNIYPR